MNTNCYPYLFPGNLTISINLTKAAIVKVEILDVLGNVVEKILQGNLTRGEYKFDMYNSEFPAGMYICKISIDNETKVINLLKTE
jgi:hypothetical protein